VSSLRQQIRQQARAREGFVDVVAAAGEQQKSAAVVEPGEGAFEDPAVAAELPAVLGLTGSDYGFDAAAPTPRVPTAIVATTLSQAQRAIPSPSRATSGRID